MHYTQPVCWPVNEVKPTNIRLLPQSADARRFVRGEFGYYVTRSGGGVYVVCDVFFHKDIQKNSTLIELNIKIMLSSTKSFLFFSFVFFIIRDATSLKNYHSNHKIIK